MVDGVVEISPNTVSMVDGVVEIVSDTVSMVDCVVEISFNTVSNVDGVVEISPDTVSMVDGVVEIPLDTSWLTALSRFPLTQSVLHHPSSRPRGVQPEIRTEDPREKSTSSAGMPG